MQAAVTCESLVKRFGGVAAVDGVSLSLPEGCFMALLGPSGCGKTTTLRLIAGLERPDSGLITLHDKTVFGGGVFVPPNQRHIGMVFQEYALFPHMTVEKNIAYGLPRHLDKRARIAEMLELVGLVGLEKRFPGQLSGGQQQRVALARALAPQPDTLLLDEPFSNLDAGLRVQLREEVRSIIKTAGVSALLVTHDQDEALSMADRIAVMFQGKIAQVGTPRDLYECPASVEVARFLGEVNILTGQAAGMHAETALGRLALCDPFNGAVQIALRPEEVILGGQGIPATVERVNYFGARQTVFLRLSDNTLLKASLGSQPILEPGMITSVRVESAVTAFPA